jgi:hypothetical protein
MADETNPTKPGVQSTEFKLSLANIITGFLAVVAGVATTLKDIHELFPGAQGIGVALAGCGFIAMVAERLGYGKERTAIKVAMIQAGAMTAINGVKSPDDASTAQTEIIKNP